MRDFQNLLHATTSFKRCRSSSIIAFSSQFSLDYGPMGDYMTLSFLMPASRILSTKVFSEYSGPRNAIRTARDRPELRGVSRYIAG